MPLVGCMLTGNNNLEGPGPSGYLIKWHPLVFPNMNAWWIPHIL